MRILLVEDEVRLSEALEHLFKKEKYQIDIVDNGLDAVDYIMSDIYNVVVLDVMLPGLDGFQVLKTIRDKGNNVSVIMLTAKSEVMDKVQGLDSGADDYLTKPYESKELLARVRALLRRKELFVNDAQLIGDLKYDKRTMKLSRNELTVTLSHLEAELFLLLLHSKKIVSKDEIIVELWGYDSEAEDNNVEVYVSMLRRKLKFLNTSVSIKTTRNVGYSLEVPHV